MVVAVEGVWAGLATHLWWPNFGSAPLRASREPASLPAMSRITHAEIQHIASLARLSLDAEAREGMKRDMERILEYVAALDELDTEGIEPTAHAIALSTPMREDEAVPGMDPELAVATAPDSSGTAFRVPKVLEGEEG